jgi:hypothetical protein
VASINVQTARHCVTLKYRSRFYGDDWSDVEQRVSVAWTPCRFGGERPRFCVFRRAKRCALRAAGHQAVWRRLAVCLPPLLSKRSAMPVGKGRRLAGQAPYLQQSGRREPARFVLAAMCSQAVAPRDALAANTAVVGAHVSISSAKPSDATAPSPLLRPRAHQSRTPKNRRSGEPIARRFR